MPNILLVDKPSGISSAQVVARVKKFFLAKKVGHAGTLDPLATGLLVILVGSATKLASFALKGEKRYTGTILLGVTTATDDIEGEILTRSDAIPSFSEILKAATKFQGNISQVPPQISAVKIDGKRAYERARAGQEFEIKARQVSVSDFQLDLLSQDELQFSIRTSPGTYIRSIARDLGDELGCGATIKTLRREYSYPFDVSSSVSLDEMKSGDLLCWSKLFPETPVIELEERLCKGILQGQRYLLGKVPNPGQGTLEGSYAILKAPGMEPQSLLIWKNNTWDLLCNVV